MGRLGLNSRLLEKRRNNALGVNTAMRSANTDALWISLEEEEDDVPDSTDSLEEEEEDDSLGEVTGALYISPADRYQGPVIGGLPSPRGMGRLQDRFLLQLVAPSCGPRLFQ